MDAALKALAEPRRRAILRLVWSQELPATDIADRFGDVTRPAISQHLAVLKDAKLVTERRDGTRRLYRANPETVAELRAFLDDYWTSGLERLRDVAEAAQARTREGAHARRTTGRTTPTKPARPAKPTRPPKKGTT
ncbi:MAG TPA: metalloregulator ArsR/SmtB family transcription factor [Acidimicrobiales bacterium]|nr:metalloregulator ArsR/SmtB family transcription factor [Acidimicrobiales bacterium]